MATYKSLQLTNLDAKPSAVANAMDVYGKVRIIRCQYTMLGTESADETVELCRLVKGVKVQPFGKAGTVGGIGGTSTIDIGYAAYTDEAAASISADPDAFLDGGNLASGGAIVDMDAVAGWGFQPKPDPNALGGGYVSIIATFKTLATPTADSVLEVFLVVVQD
jgi:hypothetical protein